jgi:hypothetical protein
MAERKASGDTDQAATDEAIDQIYRGDFDGFIRRRDELAKHLKAQGGAEAASRIRALKKPSRGAWVVNQLSLRESGLRDELLQAGAALREAHERVLTGEGDHSDLRAASEKERAAVARAYEAAGSLAEEDGARLSPAAGERVRQTLHAVALDEEVRDEFQSGRLRTEHEATGMGGPMAGAPAPAKRRPKTPSPKNREREEAKRRRAELKTAEAELVKLERRLQEAKREVEAASETAERAQRALKRASEDLEKKRSETEAARARAEGLRGPGA